MNVKLVVIKGPTRAKAIPIRERKTVIGRESTCGLRIPSGEVSRLHCLLTVEGGSVTVKDLGSANGTLLNGRRVSGTREVQPGDELEIGPLTFRVEYQKPNVARRRPADEESVVELEVLPEDDEEVVQLEVLPEDDEVNADALAEIAEVEVVDDEVFEPEVLSDDAIKPVHTTPPKRRPPPVPAKIDDTEEEIVLELDDESWKLPNDADLGDILGRMDDK